MKQYLAGQWTKGGTYCDPKTGEFVMVPKGGGALPGELDKKYIKIPLVMVMISGPFMGLLYAIFLPLLGIVGLVTFFGQRVGQRIGDLRRGWLEARTREATLKAGGKGLPGKKQDDDRWDDIARW